MGNKKYIKSVIECLDGLKNIKKALDNEKDCTFKIKTHYSLDVFSKKDKEKILKVRKLMV